MAVILNVFIGKSRGGIEVVCSDYAKTFAAQGHHSYLLGAKGRDYIEYLQNTGLPVKLLAGRNINPFTLLQFAWFLAKLKPDIVFLHGTRAVTVGTKWYICRFFPKIKFVGVSHGVADKRYSKLKYAVAITGYLYRFFEDLKIPHIYSCPNMTTVFPFKNKLISESTTPTEQMLPKTGNPSDRPDAKPFLGNRIRSIGSMGRFSSAKGFDVLIAAAGILKTKGLPFKLKLAGFSLDECENMLKAHNITKETEVIGWTNDKNSFYQSIDIYVSASRFESFGLTIIESMAESLPVVATNTIGASEIISSGVDGIIVPNENPEALAEALAFLITAEDKVFTDMRKAGHSKTEQKYNLAKLPVTLDTIVKEILETAGA